MMAIRTVLCASLALVLTMSSSLAAETAAMPDSAPLPSFMAGNWENREPASAVDCADLDLKQEAHQLLCDGRKRMNENVLQLEIDAEQIVLRSSGIGVFYRYQLLTATTDNATVLLQARNGQQAEFRFVRRGEELCMGNAVQDVCFLPSKEK